MSRPRLAVVLSQAQGKNPAKRALEESIVAALIMESGLDVSVVPHLVDLDARHTGRMFLESIQGDMVFLSWLFPRAAFWLLDRDNIKGQWGETLLKPPADDEDQDTETPPEPPRGIGALNVPDRFIYCLDLRDANNHEPFIEEIRRLAIECKTRNAAKAQPKLIDLGLNLRNGHPTSAELKTSLEYKPDPLMAAPDRRWYPVIDYSRCTNCLECLDFCLFGVYGVDGAERINVENQDNCKRGCPACSRVCPEQAIIFPDYKTPAIAGAPVGAIGALKIDLSRLFGGENQDALSQAVAERDRELVADGRQAVGMSVGLPKRQADKPTGPKDELDDLMDALDQLDL